MSRLSCAAMVGALIFPALMLAAPTRADTVDLDAAKREGKVVWYTSLPIALSQRLAGLFEQSSGIKVELFRSRRQRHPAPFPAGEGCRPRAR